MGGLIIKILIGGICAALICFFGFVLKCSRKARAAIKDKHIRDILSESKEKEVYRALDDISAHLKIVIVALEDPRFFKHRGYDHLKILNAIYVDIKFRQKRAGGSTITQQLAKNLYFTAEKTYTRKLSELFASIYIERNLTKEEILELYLNIIFYGNEQYGIEQACSYYFEKEPKDISFNQAITIRCILPSPDNYNPITNPELFYKVRSKALQTLCKFGIVNRENIFMFENSLYNETLN